MNCENPIINLNHLYGKYSFNTDDNDNIKIIGGIKDTNHWYEMYPLTFIDESWQEVHHERVWSQYFHECFYEVKGIIDNKGKFIMDESDFQKMIKVFDTMDNYDNVHKTNFTIFVNDHVLIGCKPTECSIKKYEHNDTIREVRFVWLKTIPKEEFCNGNKILE